MVEVYSASYRLEGLECESGQYANQWYLQVVNRCCLFTAPAWFNKFVLIDMPCHSIGDSRVSTAGVYIHPYLRLVSLSDSLSSVKCRISNLFLNTYVLSKVIPAHQQIEPFQNPALFSKALWVATPFEL